jgi:hypothetical protein
MTPEVNSRSSCRENAVPDTIVTAGGQVLESDAERAGLDHTVVTVAVASARLNSNRSETVIGGYVVVEHGSVAVLRAPRFVAQWLSDHGTFSVSPQLMSADPVQVLDVTLLRDVMETAAVLWNPYAINGAYSSFTDAVAAASHLCGSIDKRD